MAAREGPRPRPPSAPTARTAQGAVAVVVDGNVGAHRRAQVRDRLRRQGRRLRRRWSRSSPTRSRPRARTPSTSCTDEIDDLKVTLKENIELGQVVRFEARRRQRRSTPTCTCQDGRGVNGCSSSSPAATPELAHDIAVHIAFAKPELPHAATRCPADEVDAERATLEDISRDEGKPEQALAKIVEGRLNGLFKERVPARAAVRQGRQADRSASCSAAAHDRPLRPGRSIGLSSMTDRRADAPLAPGRAQALGRGVRRRRSGYGIDGDVVERIADEIVEVRARPRRRHRRRRRRRQHLAGHDRRRRGHGPRPGRLHGHARHGHQRARAAGRARAARPAHPGADRDHDGRRSPSRTSAAGRSATSRRAGS